MCIYRWVISTYNATLINILCKLRLWPAQSPEMFPIKYVEEMMGQWLTRSANPSISLSLQQEDVKHNNLFKHAKCNWNNHMNMQSDNIQFKEWYIEANVWLERKIYFIRK